MITIVTAYIQEDRRIRFTGFSLVELLVVMAIIIVLIAMLVPSFYSFAETSKAVTCRSNERQLQLGYTEYMEEHSWYMPGSHTGRNADDWVRYTGSTQWEKQDDGIKQGSLWPHVQSLGVYQCPNYPFVDRFKYYYRNYSLNNYLNGEGWGYPVRESIMKVAVPARTITFIEEPDPRKGLMGSWVTEGRRGRNIRDGWVDPVGTWHQDGINFAFLDGHTEYWQWKDARTLNIGFSFFKVTPNNQDLYRIKAHSCPGDPGSPWKDIETEQFEIILE